MMRIKVLFSDPHLMVIDKPPGVTVNRADTVGEETVQDWIESKFKVEADDSAAKAFVDRAGIIHRLDKETSGCLIIAKTPAVFAEVQRQFKAREVKKEYLALVHGWVESKSGAIRVPLSRSRFDRQKFAVSPGGRFSETSYRVISRLTNNILSARHASHSEAGGRFTLLRLFPRTGRTHQIRVHLKYFGHPIAADAKYGGQRAAAGRRWCPRLFLHAARISFTHPVKKQFIMVRSPLPADLGRALKAF